MDCDPDRLVWELGVRGSGPYTPPDEEYLARKEMQVQREYDRRPFNLELGRLKMESSTAG